MRVKYGHLIGGLVAVSAIGLSGCRETPSEVPVREAAGTEHSMVVAAPIEDASSSPKLTGPQRNAARSARDYLNMSGFSREGLIEQLSSSYGEGYVRADAVIAVDSLDVDWNENAAKSARDYLRMTGFSCNGLVEQLSSSYGDKYTLSQARYGAMQAGAC